MNGKNKFEVKLKSEMYNHDNEHIIKRQEIKENKYNTNNLTMTFVIGFIIFIILLILIITLTR